MFTDYCPVIDVPNMCKHEEQEPLGRFIEAQNRTYEDAVKELKAGKKVTHWMWWVFPQYRGLGTSELTKYYAIQSREEARAYWEHPVLGERLRECMRLLLELDTDDAVKIFGEIDAQKLKSCMTLFYFHGGKIWCGNILEKFFPRGLDWATATLLLKE